MADLLVNDYYNLTPSQAANFNAPKYFYKNQSQKKGKQTGTSFVDNNAVFTANMAGGLIEFASNADGVGYSYSAIILAVVDANTLTLDVSQEINATDYTIWYGGVQLDQNGYLSVAQLMNNGLAVNAVITKDIVLTSAALASAAQVVIFPAVTTTTSYKVRDIKVNYSAAGLSGGGGNRLLSITDGTTIYNTNGITAALLGTPVNTVWGGTGSPLPGAVAMSTATIPGTNLFARYIGGSADYSAGSVTISVTVERVA